jgi:hypothetical protein
MTNRLVRSMRIVVSKGQIVVSEVEGTTRLGACRGSDEIVERVR